MMYRSDLKRIGWKLSLLALALLLTLSLVACAHGQNEEYGKEQSTAGAGAEQWGSAPDFMVLDAESKAVYLSDFAGKPIVVNFWATWCGYCKVEMPDFHKAYLAYPDVVFLMVNVTDGVYETKEKADAYVAQEGFTFDIYYDAAGLAQSAYRISGYPTTIFINAQGDVVAKEVGAISYDTLVQGIGLISE